MKKRTLTATGFLQKTYAKPKIQVIEIESAGLLSGSGDDNESYEDGSTEGWYNENNN